MTQTTRKTYCSICSAFCGFEATIENNRVIDFKADPSHPMSRGFSCTKGRHFPELLNADNRYTHVLKRQPDKTFEPTAPAVALDDIADTLRRVIDQYGPQSVGIYYGNGISFKAFTTPAIKAWMEGIGSLNTFSTMTIDQPAKLIATGRHGIWAAGADDFETADVAMLIGSNPVVSGLHAPGGPAGWRPAEIKEAKKRGLKLIVIDPRRCETAQQADLHLAVMPGEDAVLLAGIINVLVERGLHDTEFVAEFTEDFELLMEQLAPFTLTLVAERTGLSAEQITLAAEMFGERIDGRRTRGHASSGTGPDMGPYGNATEHLIKVLNALCGRYKRVGETASGSLLTPDIAPMAAVIPRDFMPDFLNPAVNTARSRVSEGHQVYLQMPGSTLADEILTPGDGQIRALLVIGGNPVMSMPNGEKMRRALQSLELLVAMEVRETDTSIEADYILPCSYGIERPEMTLYNDFLWNKPFHQFADKLVDPPGDISEEWLYLAELAKRLGTKMTLPGGDLNLESVELDDLMNKLYAEGMIKLPLSEIASHEGGKLYDDYADLEVTPAFEGMDERFQLMPDGVHEELLQLSNKPPHLIDAEKYSHLLICRRNKYVYNSMCHELSKTAKANPAYMHPEDIAELGANEGDEIKLCSAFGEINTLVAADHQLRRGVVSTSHSFGSKVNAEQQSHFARVSTLLSSEYSNDPHARMPIMSAVPITVTRV